jgi:hypothetical protein
MADTNDIVPRAEPFPWRRLVEKFGPHQFSSSIAWMMAFAIDQNEDAARAYRDGQGPQPSIGLWGVDMAADGEWENQRPGCHHFMWVAADRGFEIIVPPESDLHRAPPLYAIGEGSPMQTKYGLHRRELNERMRDSEARASQAQQEAWMLRGALKEGEYIERTWME